MKSLRLHKEAPTKCKMVEGSYETKLSHDYDAFKHHNENRDVETGDDSYKKLKAEIEIRGYLIEPIVCQIDENGVLIIANGQHRRAVLEELGWPIPYTVNHLSKNNEDIKIANSAKPWRLKDHIVSNRKKGIPGYNKLEELVEEHGGEFGISNIAYFFNKHDSEYTSSSQVKNGDLELDLEGGYTIIGNLFEMKEAGFKKYKSSKFSNSLKKIIRRNPGRFDIARLAHVHEELKISHTVSDTMLSIINSYNYKLSDMKKIY